MEIILLVIAAVGALALLCHILPEQCRHGVSVRPNRADCCRECTEERQQREEGARRKAEEERRTRERLWKKEAEDIRQLTYLQETDPIEFERIIHRTFRNIGWEVEGTPASGDRGVDAYMRRNGTMFILQCKRLSSAKVGSPVLRDLLGAIVAEVADGGIIVTTSSFSEDAIRWASRVPKPIELVDGNSLLKLIASAYSEESAVPNDFNPRRRHRKLVPSRCPSCGAKTRRVKGPNGPFYGCRAFPRCRWSMNAPGRWTSRAKRQAEFDDGELIWDEVDRP